MMPPFGKYEKLYLDAKHIEKGLTRGGELVGLRFSKKVPLSANIKHCPKFQD